MFNLFHALIILEYLTSLPTNRCLSLPIKIHINIFPIFNSLPRPFLHLEERGSSFPLNHLIVILIKSLIPVIYLVRFLFCMHIICVDIIEIQSLWRLRNVVILHFIFSEEVYELLIDVHLYMFRLRSRYYDIQRELLIRCLGDIRYGAIRLSIHILVQSLSYTCSLWSAVLYHKLFSIFKLTLSSILDDCLLLIDMFDWWLKHAFYFDLWLTFLNSDFVLRI